MLLIRLSAELYPAVRRMLVGSESLLTPSPLQILEWQLMETYLQILQKTLLVSPQRLKTLLMDCGVPKVRQGMIAISAELAHKVDKMYRGQGGGNSPVSADVIRTLSTLSSYGTSFFSTFLKLLSTSFSKMWFNSARFSGNL